MKFFVKDTAFRRKALSYPSNELELSTWQILFFFPPKKKKKEINSNQNRKPEVESKVASSISSSSK